MKIIIRNRNKKIETVNLTSKEEMVWIQPELYTQITVDAAEMAMEFMKKHPQIHEVKFSVLPQLDEEENEEDFYADDQSDSKERKVVIFNEDVLKEQVESFRKEFKSAYSLEEIYDELRSYDAMEPGNYFGFGICKDDGESRRCYDFAQLSFSDEVVEYEYKGLSKV